MKRWIVYAGLLGALCSCEVVLVDELGKETRDPVPFGDIPHELFAVTASFVGDTARPAYSPDAPIVNLPLAREAMIRVNLSCDACGAYFFVLDQQGEIVVEAYDFDDASVSRFSRSAVLRRGQYFIVAGGMNAGAPGTIDIGTYVLTNTPDPPAGVLGEGLYGRPGAMNECLLECYRQCGCTYARDACFPPPCNRRGEIIRALLGDRDGSIGPDGSIVDGGSMRDGGTSARWPSGASGSGPFPPDPTAPADCDRNHCVDIVEINRGGNCFGPSSTSINVLFQNRCAEEIAITGCLWRTDVSRWSCFASSSVLPEETAGAWYVCESTGDIAYGAIPVSTDGCRFPREDEIPPP